MEGVIQLLCIFLVNCFLETKAYSTSNICQKEPFYEFRNKSYAGHILVREGPWPLRKCRRLCRQYLECLSFSVEWTNDKFGVCTIYDGAIHTTNLVDQDEVTMYTRVPCPTGFQWYMNLNRCYSSRVYENVAGADIINFCRELHPKAKPVEPRNGAQMAIIEQISGGRSVWLGMHRPEDSNILEDFRYYSDGTNITYHNWNRGDPNNSGRAENCVASIAHVDYMWGDVFCSRTFGLICEL